MAYSGYLDRWQDTAEWCKEHQPLYDDKPQLDHQSTYPADPKTSVVRPATMKHRYPPGSNLPLPQPSLQDEENLKRFYRLWGLPDDEAPSCFGHGSKKADREDRNKQNTTSTYSDLFAERAIMFTADKTLLITNRGFLGSGSPKIRPGDSLAIIRGCCMPIVKCHKTSHGHTGV
ncbi:hypothetical protein QBC45DRAFT_94370 [Copromyces sp. CBS 386.78]|nr:hypothetical protein QBC45DRAFT_94370 [Copromyces sp. CBS 386.78]